MYISKILIIEQLEYENQHFPMLLAYCILVHDQSFMKVKIHTFCTSYKYISIPVVEFVLVKLFCYPSGNIFQTFEQFHHRTTSHRMMKVVK